MVLLCSSKVERSNLNTIGGREIATYQSIRDLLRNAGFSTWREYHEKYLKASN
jgi:hypothetical protein